MHRGQRLHRQEGQNILTPPLSSGCLEGVTRAILFELARTKGVPMEERTLLPKDVYEADEVFISSTNRSVLAVGEVAGHKVPQVPGPVTKVLDAAITAYIAEYVAARTVKV
jgi:branched-chain amino acid aminotransferase